MPLFVYVHYTSNGKRTYAHIETRSGLHRKPDAKIGDFGENWWTRPKQALKGKPYKTLAAFKSACTQSLKKIKPDATWIEYTHEDGTPLT